MRTDIWHEVCAELTALLRERSVEARVVALGVRDLLADGVGSCPATAGALDPGTRPHEGRVPDRRTRQSQGPDTRVKAKPESGERPATTSAPAHTPIPHGPRPTRQSQGPQDTHTPDTPVKPGPDSRPATTSALEPHTSRPGQGRLPGRRTWQGQGPQNTHTPDTPVKPDPDSRPAATSAPEPHTPTPHTPRPLRALVPGQRTGPASTPFTPASHSPARRTPVPVHLYGHHALVGPLPDPVNGPTPQRPCPTCLARRWQSVRRPALRDALELGSGTRAAGRAPYATAFAADAVAALVAAHRERATPGSERPFPAVYLLDLETLRVSRHRLVADPGCPRCGDPVPDGPEVAAITLGPAPKKAPGSFRVRDITAYPLPADAFANPVCGALGPEVVHDVTSPSTAATVGAFTLRSGAYLRETFWGGHADSYADSERIGILEGLERTAGLRPHGKRTTVVAPLDELGEQAVDPRRCGLYGEEFHRENPGVPPFSPDRPIPWVWGWSLRDQRPLLVPEALAHYGTPALANRFVQESSNGCASGGSLEEAVYFGLMEAVERDAFLLAWYGRAALPEIDPRTSTHPRTRQMVDRLALYGYEARFFDTRITFPIPVVTAVAVRRDGGLGALCFGAGASLDPEAALRGGLCEIATDAMNIRARTLRDERRLRAMAADFDKVLSLHDHPLVYGLPEMAPHAAFLLGQRAEKQPLDALAGPLPVSDDLGDDVEACVAAVTAAGFDVVVVDQTLPEQRALGLYTVSVLVPGLLPIDFGWRRQRALRMPRTRTALREAGLRERDLAPGELNPAPHPFP
ncbi:TOMM precursor leader peptide-binding protein [Streptomyces gamaensis]|uniref:TOMM leader peptide-binding protein n=1 Tax=Streptomyces gamaensis TaxID=1763542 RepID=A0ABW0Z2B8_9ACTN